MPDPKPGESEQEFVSRCVPIVIHEGATKDQALGKCYGMFRNAKKEEGRKQVLKAILQVKTLLTKAEEEEAVEKFSPEVMDTKYGKGKKRGFVSANDLPEEGQGILTQVYSRCRMDGGDKETCQRIAWNATVNAGFRPDSKAVILKTLENKLANFVEVRKARALEGRTEMHGFKISIENDKGSVRQGIDQDGHEWKTVMPCPYGYIRMTEGSDGEHVDCFCGDNENSSKVFVVHIQNPKTKEYDEDKVFLGFDSEQQVRETFDKAYDRKDIWQSMDEFEVEKFKELLGKREGVKIKKSLQKARTVSGFESPEPGDLPEKGAKILASAYASCRKDGGDKEKCAKIAWAAVRNAGY